MSSPTWSRLLDIMLSGQDLAATDTAWAMRQLLAGTFDPVEFAGFLVALRAKGETPQEIAGSVEGILDGSVRLRLDTAAVDVVGTGGDQTNTVNVSTMAAIVVAGAGIPVVKHGGRSVSSKCGSADVIEALGVPLDLSPEAVVRCVETAGIGYAFAPRFHPGLRHAAPVRNALGVPTVMNWMAPLLNPAQPRAGCIGCATTATAPTLAKVLSERGSSALVVRGEDGLDEASVAAPTRVWMTVGTSVRETVFDAADLGLPRCRTKDLVGGDVADNVAVVRRVLKGETGPVRDTVVLNAAVAIASHRGLDNGLINALASGLREAEQAIDSGAAETTLDRWVSTAASCRQAHQQEATQS